jgi:type III secretion system FlhB-like substrate exporter
MAEISSIASEVNLKEGEIWIDPLGKVSFSREIPETIHQRIRNVISLY